MIEAKQKTIRGTLTVLCSADGNAKIEKPSGNALRVYGKTPSELMIIVNNILEGYKKVERKRLERTAEKSRKS